MVASNVGSGPWSACGRGYVASAVAGFGINNADSDWRGVHLPGSGTEVGPCTVAAMVASDVGSAPWYSLGRA